MLENIIWMLVIMGLTAIVGILVLKDKPKKYSIIILAELALVLRFVFVFIAYSNGTEYSGTDGLIYHQIAKDIALQLKSGVSLWNVEYEYTWYTVLIGIQYAIFGVSRYAASFINAFISIFSGFLLMNIASGMNYSHKRSTLIGLVYLFIPSMIVWTADTRKESMIFFIIILIWYITLKVLKEKKRPMTRNILAIVAVCLLIWLCTLLRIYMVFALGIGLVICLIFCYFKTKQRLPLLFLSAVIITCIIVTFTTVRSNLSDYHALPIDETKIGDDNLDGEFDSIFKTILEKDIPDSINGFLTKPHLDDVPLITDIAANPSVIIIVKLEMILWYLCLIAAVFGVMYALIKQDPYSIGILIFIVAYGLINALISEEVPDTYYRYRAAIIAPVLLFADYKLFINKLKELLLRKDTIESTSKSKG